ncbi:MAG TPA: hypothetical protein VJP60_07135 [Rhizomicrobium sp.]|nr:hypothetical protein [Rhizomicrobium sp.]
MRTFKSVFGAMGAIMPILYCGSLLYYFLDLSGSVEEAKTDGLGPTLLGLGVGGLIFCIPLVFKIVRIFTRPPSPGSGPDAPGRDDGFDADAAIARYMAQRSAEAASGSPAARPAHQGGGTARRPGFGRRNG